MSRYSLSLLLLTSSLALLTSASSSVQPSLEQQLNGYAREVSINHCTIFIDLREGLGQYLQLARLCVLLSILSTAAMTVLLVLLLNVLALKAEDDKPSPMTPPQPLSQASIAKERNMVRRVRSLSRRRSNLDEATSLRKKSNKTHSMMASDAEKLRGCVELSPGSEKLKVPDIMVFDEETWEIRSYHSAQDFPPINHHPKTESG